MLIWVCKAIEMKENGLKWWQSMHNLIFLKRHLLSSSCIPKSNWGVWGGTTCLHRNHNRVVFCDHSCASGNLKSINTGSCLAALIYKKGIIDSEIRNWKDEFQAFEVHSCCVCFELETYICQCRSCHRPADSPGNSDPQGPCIVLAYVIPA